MQPRVVVGAGDRNRTGDVQLGNFLTVVSRTLRATALTSESHAVSLLLTQFGQHPGQQAPGRRPEAAVGLGEPVEGTIRDADAVLAEPAVDILVRRRPSVSHAAICPCGDASRSASAAGGPTGVPRTPRPKAAS